MANYDSAVLQQYADKLYDKAQMMILTAFLIWGFVATLIAFCLFAAFQASQHQPAGSALIPAMFVGLIFSGIGCLAAKEKAFMLRLEAQKILLQMQLEANTRRGAVAVG